MPVTALCAAVLTHCALVRVLRVIGARGRASIAPGDRAHPLRIAGAAATKRVPFGRIAPKVMQHFA